MRSGQINAVQKLYNFRTLLLEDTTKIISEIFAALPSDPFKKPFASPSGTIVAISKWQQQDVRALCSADERSLYRSPDAVRNDQMNHAMTLLHFHEEPILVGVRFHRCCTFQ